MPQSQQVLAGIEASQWQRRAMLHNPLRLEQLHRELPEVP